MIVAFNATAYDERPSGARARTVGLAAALLRRGAAVRIFIPIDTSMREEVAREHGGELPLDRFEQIPVRLDPSSPVRRSVTSRNFLARRISRDTAALVTDYYPVLTKLPTMLTVHDLRYFAARRFESSVRGAWFRARFPRLARRAARVVVPTEAVKREVVEFTGADVSRVVVVGNGVSAAWRSARPAEGQGRHFLAIGMDERRKEFALLLRAIRLAPGAPPLVVTMRRRPPLSGRGLVRAGRVKFVISPKDAELVALCRDAVALLHPSRYEGFGMPVLEAMSLGIPVLAACDPAVEEVAGGFATLLPPGDAMAWAAEMTSVTPAAPEARAHALGFSWDASAATLIEEIEAANAET